MRVIAWLRRADEWNARQPRLTWPERLPMWFAVLVGVAIMGDHTTGRPAFARLMITFGLIVLTAIGAIWHSRRRTQRQTVEHSGK